MFVAAIAFAANTTAAQVFVMDDPEPEMQRARIGLVDEFIKRFNGDQRHPDLQTSTTDSIDWNLLWLFDQEQLMNADRSVQDSIQTEVLNLIGTIREESVKINYTDSAWVAIAHCKGTVMGKQENFDIFMTVQPRGEDMYKWVINAVKGDCFNIQPPKDTGEVMIYPDAHETKFLALKRICKEQPKNIRLFMYKDFEYAPTSVFAYLVYSGNLKVEYVERLEFMFLQVPNYAFHIQYFERPSNNNGWLISNFYPLSDSDKAAFRRMINQKTPDDTASCVSFSSIAQSVVPSDSVVVKGMEEKPEIDLLQNRIKERIKLLEDYITFISSHMQDKHTQKFYVEKFVNLFSPDANVVIKDNNTGKTSVVSVKRFADSLMQGKFVKLSIDAVTTVVFDVDDNQQTTMRRTAIIPLSSTVSDAVLRPVCGNLLNCHAVDTEDGVEYISDFGDLYVSVN